MAQVHILAMRYAIVLALISFGSVGANAAEENAECRWSKAMRSDQTVHCPIDDVPPIVVGGGISVYGSPPGERQGPSKTGLSQQAQSQASEAKIYPNELLRDPQFRAYYVRMLAKAGSLPTWVRRYNSTGDSLQFPIHTFIHKRRKYVLARICKPREATECLDMLFAPDLWTDAAAYYSINGRGEWITGDLWDISLAEAVERKISDPSYFN